MEADRGIKDGQKLKKRQSQLSGTATSQHLSSHSSINGNVAVSTNMLAII